MATHPGMLLAYDADGNVIATLDYMIQYDDDPERTPLGLVRWDVHEEAGGEHTDIWQVEGAKGSKVWPEHLGGKAHDFRVELEGPAGGKHIAALVHRESGHRRARSTIETEISRRLKVGHGTADIRDLVGGPTNALTLDDKGKTMQRPKIRRPVLPLAAPHA